MAQKCKKEFNSTEYKHQYNKRHYNQTNVCLSVSDYATLEEFSDNLQLSKSQVLQKCLVYCYENDIELT